MSLWCCSGVAATMSCLRVRRPTKHGFIAPDETHSCFACNPGL